MARKKIKPNEKIILATLKLAETMPWQEVTMNKIAKAAKIENSTLNENFSSKLSILSAFNRQLDEQAMKNFSNITNMGSIREQIFEILMARFDSLNLHKIALNSIYKETVPIDPIASSHGFNNLINSMEIILNIVGIATRSPLGCIKTKVLGAIFFRSFRTWLKDESPDMAKTMATLDKDLAKAETIMKSLNNC
ncbi:MAG: TetR/AcrR family transcriptional regulator [Pseudomonadota bacterium]|nr:TetR/AcrR family transcriptional regulator [Pseudomonadota bacterium]